MIAPSGKVESSLQIAFPVLDKVSEVEKMIGVGMDLI